MALLQISEPGQSPEPHKARLAVGIDLGTTNSLVATVRSGIPVVLPDAQGRPLLPSIVRYLKSGKVEVGYPAQARQAPVDLEDRREHELAVALRGVLEHGELQILARAEMGEEPGLRHPGRFGERTDRQVVKPGPADQAQRFVEDRGSGALTLSRGRLRGHGSTE